MLTKNEDKLYRRTDGDGREVKRTTNDCRIMEINGEPPPEECSWSGEASLYYIRSTVLGGETISEVNSSGGKLVSYVRVGTSILAHLRSNHIWQQGSYSDYEAVYYEQTDASGMSFRTTKRQMPTGYGDYSDERQAEFDAGGANVGLETNRHPQYGTVPNDFPPLEDTSPLWINGQETTFTMDGMRISAQEANNLINTGYIGGYAGMMQILANQSAIKSTTYTFSWNTTDSTSRVGNEDGSWGEASGSAPSFNIQVSVSSSFRYANTSWFGFGSISQTRQITQNQENKWTELKLSLNHNNDIRQLLQNSDCAKFVNDLLKNASALTGRTIDSVNTAVDYLLNHLDEITYDEGAYVKPDGEVFPYPTALGPFGNKPTIYMNTQPFRIMSLEHWKSSTREPITIWMAQSIKAINGFRYGQALTALHESLHLVGFSDIDFARALNKDWKQNENESLWDYIKRSSLFWNESLKKNCGHIESLH